MKFAGLCFENLCGKDSPQSKVLNDSVIDVMERLFVEYSGFGASNTAPIFGSSSQSRVRVVKGHKMGLRLILSKMSMDMKGWILCTRRWWTSWDFRIQALSQSYT